MYSYINSGDLNDMTDFDLSALNGLISVCSFINVSQSGIDIWLKSRHNVYISKDKISFSVLGKAFKFDSVLIEYDNYRSTHILNFTIQCGDSEVYLSLVSDV